MSLYFLRVQRFARRETATPALLLVSESFICVKVLAFDGTFRPSITSFHYWTSTVIFDLMLSNDVNLLDQEIIVTA